MIRLVALLTLLSFSSCNISDEDGNENSPRDLTEENIENDPNLKCAFYVETKANLSGYDITQNFKVFYQRYTQTVTKSTCHDILAEGSTQLEYFRLERSANSLLLEAEKGRGVSMATIRGTSLSFPSQTEDLGSGCVLKGVYSGSLNPASATINSKSVLGLIGSCGAKSIKTALNLKSL